MPKHATLINTEQGNLQHAWTDTMTESVISGAGGSFGWQLKIVNFKILTYAKPVPKAMLWNSFGRNTEFLEYWNTQKSVWRIWQHFSCLLDEGIPKLWKKFNSHDGFLSHLQNSTVNSAHLAVHFCPVLVCPQKATMRIQFLRYFWNPLM